MYESELTDDLLYLVGLQMPDEMPVAVLHQGRCQSLTFLQGFLNAVFTKFGDTAVPCFLYLRKACRLGHSDEFHWSLRQDLSYAGYVCSHTHAFLISETHH